MKLPALLLSKIVVPDPIRGPSFRWSVLLAEDRSAFEPTTAKSAPKIQNPAPSAGHNPVCSGIPRDARLFYPVLIRRLTIGVCSLEYFRPDCESPAQPDTFRECRTICNLTTPSHYVKSSTELFSSAFHTPVEAVKIPRKPLISAFPPGCFPPIP
jgi:hypothetical protein